MLEEKSEPGEVLLHPTLEREEEIGEQILKLEEVITSSEMEVKGRKNRYYKGNLLKVQS